MPIFYIVFLVPIILYVVAFLYETLLSFRRLSNLKAGRTGYVSSTWEITHTLLVFSIVMLVMTFTQDITELAQTLYISAFIAAIALGLRAVCYMYIFYVRDGNKQPGAIDWAFALTHVAAAIFLVATVVKALLFIWQNNPTPNEQFFPVFIPGLLLVVGLCVFPMIVLYKAK